MGEGGERNRGIGACLVGGVPYPVWVDGGCERRQLEKRNHRRPRQAPTLLIGDLSPTLLIGERCSHGNSSLSFTYYASPHNQHTYPGRDTYPPGDKADGDSNQQQFHRSSSPILISYSHLLFLVDTPTTLRLPFRLEKARVWE